MVHRDGKVAVEPAIKALTFAIAALVFLAVLVYVSPTFLAAFLFLFFCACWSEYRGHFLPRIALTIASFAIIGLFLYRLRLTDLAPQGVETLLLLLAIKLLERKAFRDYMQIYLISIFVLAGSALLGINFIFLSYLVVLALLLNAAMVLGAYYKEDPGMTLMMPAFTKILLKSSLIPVCAIPLGALVFVITPRSPYPLLDFLNQANRSSTGFSDRVSLGKVSAIQQDGSAVLRAAMKPIPEEDLYWRGLVLDHFDGTTWKPTYARMAPAGSKSAPIPAAVLWQEIYTEPHGNTYLFALDRPSHVFLPLAKEYEDGTFSHDQAGTRKIRYQAISFCGGMHSDGTETSHYTQLPSDLSTGLIELARKLRSEKGPCQTLNAIQRFLAGREFSYSLTDLPITEVPLENFIFTHKSGNCEYFASAFAVLARANGIPTRLVAGYHGGLYNNLSGYYLVSQKDAHVWVEAFVPEKGWLRYDPTPPSLQKEGASGPLAKARLYLDEINFFWVVFIVNYDVQKQINLLASTSHALTVGGSTIQIRPIRNGLFFLTCIAVLIYGGIRVGTRVRKSPSEKLSCYLFRHLKKRGYVRRTSQGLEEFVAGIEDRELRDRTLEIVRNFEEIYYRDGTFSREQVKRLRQRIKALPPSSQA